MRNTYAKEYNFLGKNKISLIPWDRDFLAELELLAQSLCKEYASFCASDANAMQAHSEKAFAHAESFENAEDFENTDYASNKQNVILVFPHGRPRRYLEGRYKEMAKKAGKAHILPRIITGGDFLSLCLAHWERGKTPYTELKTLDRISFLHEAVIRVAQTLPDDAVLRRLVEVAEEDKKRLEEDRKNSQKISQENKRKAHNSFDSPNTPNMPNTPDSAQNADSVADDESMYASEDMDTKSLSMAKFFPWAYSLDALFEECFQQLVDVIDIAHAEGEVSAFAASLLSSLRAIHAEYIELLKIDTIKDKYDTDKSDAEKINKHKTNKERASTPAFSAYRAAQFVEAHAVHTRTKEKGLPFELPDQRPDAIGITDLDNAERNLFFDSFSPEVFKDKIIIFAGFVRLTEAEETLYRYFWEKGASVVWHSDPALCEDFPSENKVHYSCVDHVQWLKRWATSSVLFCEPRKDKPNMHFYAAYDAHSQVQALKSDLDICVKAMSAELLSNTSNEFVGDMSAELTTGVDAELSAELIGDLSELGQKDSMNPYNHLSDDALAVLLPKPSLLMPVLHELPEKDINISMGYPVNRTLMGQFIELIIRLQEHRQTRTIGESAVSSPRTEGNTEGNAKNNAEENTGKNREPSSWYLWKDILSLLRHPYARMLVPYDSALLLSQNENGDKAPDTSEKEGVLGQAETEKNAWRSLLYLLEKSLRDGNVLLNLNEFLDDVLGDIEKINFVMSEDLDTFTSLFFEYSVSAWERIESLDDVANALENFVDFLLKHGSTLWQSFPLDAEALVRCVEKIVPELRENELSLDYLPKAALFTVLRQLFAEERIPFEADPLSGMQILGMLESRLLRFRKLFIMDMTESSLPGIIQQDPLMPDSLRNLLSLPDTHKRELLMAHTFYRLVAGAEDVWLYWQEGIQASEVQSSKSLRSRFVEECLWEEEKKNKALLKNGDGFLRSADCRPVAPLRRIKKSIPCTPLIKNQMRTFFEKPISSSALDTYIHCPAKFFYSYLGRLGELEEVTEGDDYRELGLWLHELLQDMYSEFVEKVFEHNEENLEALLTLFHTRLNSPEIHKFISPESYFMLKKAGEFHLRNYWKSMPACIKPLSLEQKYECDVPPSFFEKNSLGVSKIRLQGQFDRVDMRLSHEHMSGDELLGKETSTYADKEAVFSRAHDSQKMEHWILDYKTGKGKKLNKKFWGKIDLWNAIRNANESREQAQCSDILEEISQQMPSVQLPFYLYVYGQNSPDILCNAAWIFLGEEKKEVALVEIENESTTPVKKAKKATTKPKAKTTELSDADTNVGTDNWVGDCAEDYAGDIDGESQKESEEARFSWDLLDDIKTTFMPELLKFTLNHLLEANSFKALESKACLYCPHKDYC